MKIVRKTKDGESREALLKEYFINASMIAFLKRIGEEAAKASQAAKGPHGAKALARIRD